jgi:drug/metabolite transporter (DMT)-like permease
MDYVYILIADVLLGAIFVLNKKYQQYQGSGLKAGIISNLILGTFGIVISFASAGFRFEFTPYSLLISSISTLCAVSYTVIGLKILSGGKVSVYAMFLMTGGMLLPFLFGVIFLKEEISALKVIGLILITVAIAVTNLDKQKPSKKQLAMSFAVFILNGGLGICSKLNQLEGVNAVSDKGYVILGNIAKTVLCLAVLGTILLYEKHKTKAPVIHTSESEKVDTPTAISKKQRLIPYAFLLFIALFDFVSYYLQLIALHKVPTTVLFPLVSGGSIVMTAAVGMLLLREKPTKSAVIGMAVCLAGMCMFI